MGSTTPPTDLSAALRQAFLEESAAALISGAQPPAVRFENGRWFAGVSPPPGAPEIAFEDDNIIVFFGESGAHQHFFADGDDPESIRAAAREAVRSLCSDYGRYFAMPSERSDLERHGVGALNGGLVGLGFWVVLVGVDLNLKPDDYVALVLLLVVGAVIGALALAPLR